VLLVRSEGDEGIADMELLAGNGALVRLGLYVLLFWPTVGFYVYRDAKRRAVSRPLGRGVGFGFFGIAGLLAYEVRKATDESERGKSD
jgi:hypothetical protein